ncbi:sugar transferase [Dulcicalothrix desertica]|uniref:sugar transferase n=1 Tax=Dulcicalothrix desertica TaxID=32056 RepID=UPI003988C04D
MVTYKSLPLVAFKPDLRSAKGAQIQRGFIVRLLRVITLVILDAVSLVLAWRLAIYFGTPIQSPWTQEVSFLLLNVTVGLTIFITSGLYKAGTNRRNYTRVIKAISLSSILLLLIGFLYAPEVYVSRSIFLLSWLLSVIFTCASRFIFDTSTKLLRNQGAVRHAIFLITDLEEQQEQVNLIEKENCYIVQGVADSSCLDLANREQTLQYLRELGVVEAFVSWSSIKDRLYICWHFYTAGITIRILPNKRELYHPKSQVWMLGDLPCLTIPAPIVAGTDFWLKRIFDLVCSTILLIAFSPLYISIALLIKLDSPGPIFFKQDRVGLHSKKFKIWKFRTMVTNAEKLQAALEAKNEIKDGVLFKLKDDPRITKVGKFLRRYSLDELPQLFNVVLGEMSLVGPRPLPLRDVERFKTMHFIRQEVLPGITGLWQVSGRSDIDNFEEGVRLDITYIENWSVWLDLKILFKTVGVVFNKTGAY